jgi:energy-coupling factor transporter ATP-binding protein EcfA2
VALARALLLSPRLLLADEPTGNLDTKTGREMHDLFFELNRELGMTLLIVTHNDELAGRAFRKLRMVDGIQSRRGLSLIAPPLSVVFAPAAFLSVRLRAQPRRQDSVCAGCAASGAPSLSPARGQPGAPVKVPSLKVVRVQFRGNRKVEDDAIRVNLKTLPGSFKQGHLARGRARHLEDGLLRGRAGREHRGEGGGGWS